MGSRGPLEEYENESGANEGQRKEAELRERERREDLQHRLPVKCLIEAEIINTSLPQTFCIISI